MKLTRTLVLLVPTVLVAATAFAADDGTPPQMDQTWYPNQLFWLAVSFIALYTLVSSFVAPTVGNVLKTRDAAIRDAIAEAEEAKRAAESTRSHFELAGNDARTKTSELIAKTQAANSRDAAEALSKLDRELGLKAEKADARIKDAVEKATTGIGAAVQDLAQAMADKILAPAAAEPVKSRLKA